MKTSQSQLISIVILLFTAWTAAWPWPRWLPELESLVARQNNDGELGKYWVSIIDLTRIDNEKSATPTGAPQASATGESRTSNNEDSSVTSSPSRTKADSESRTTGSNAKETGSDKANDKGSGTRTATKSRTTSYDPSNPAGGVVMMTPGIMEGSQYFKIGDEVTFAWNYTNLLATPTAVNVVASCSANNQLYTIAENQKVVAGGKGSNATQAVTWDTGKYQETNLATPLLTEKYTLIIYDAQSSISANAQPGYLAVYNQYQFGMYVRQPYKPLGEWICSTCSGALSDMERRAVGMVVGMSVLTVLSFTWFVGGTGVIW